MISYDQLWNFVKQREVKQDIKNFVTTDKYNNEIVKHVTLIATLKNTI